MWDRLRYIIRKELLQALREPRMRVMLVLPPIIQLLIFGYAVNLDVEHSKLAFIDNDRTPASRELRARFAGSRYFAVIDATAESDPDLLLDRGEVQAVARILPGFGRDLARGQSASLQILIDGTNSNAASLISSQSAGVVATYSAQWLARWQRDRLVGRAVLEPVSIAIPRVTSADRVWFNPDLLSRNYFIPGVIANILVLVTIMVTAMAIVREKEIGTMEQLMVTPIQPIELMLGKTLPFALVGMVNLVMVTGVALFLFKVPFRGSFAFLAGSTILFLMTTLGAGLFISTVAQTQQQAMLSTSMFFQPAFMLSGFTFPIRNMPEVAQWITYLNPLRYYMEIVRGVFLKGSGAETYWPQMLALLGLGTVILAVSVLRFKKRLD
ncbi:MAG: ABC transporter permease [Acidobacteria bacterium]|nr:ABC transporter permease [Acidobacteriota bacterium]